MLNKFPPRTVLAVRFLWNLADVLNRILDNGPGEEKRVDLWNFNFIFNDNKINVGLQFKICL